MKKVISKVMVVAVLVSSLALSSCGEVGKCFFCGEEFKLNKMQKNSFFGETIYICEGCNNEVDSLFGE